MNVTLAERQALFYSPGATRAERLRFDNRLTVVDRIEFTDENGGGVSRELAIPYLAGMDEVRVDEAALALAGEGRPIDIAGFTVSAGSGAEQGLKLQLAVPARLIEVEFSASPLAGAVAPDTRLVVRPLTAGRAGPPAYALPPFTLASPLFAPLLGGLNNPVGGIVRLPRIAGSGWLFQLATGEAIDKLQPIAFPLSIKRVRIDALPRNVRVELLGPPAVSALWGQPESLLPESGEQPIGFTPAAQTALSAALTAASSAPAQDTLPLRLAFHSEAGGTLAVTRRTLRASYLVRPLGPRATVRLAGAWTPLTLDAPGGRKPAGSSGRLLARLLGRELNDASPLAEDRPFGGGVRLRGERRLACATAVAPRPGEVAGAAVPVVALRLFIETPEDAEAVLQLHPDVAGLPGPPVGEPVVAQCAAGHAGWLDFILRREVPVISAGAPLWISLRSNRGEVLWHGISDGKVWLDPGRDGVWQAAGLPLAAGSAPLVQVFHRPVDPALAPRVALRLADRELAADLLDGATADGGEWRRATFALPAALNEPLALGRVTPGRPRATTTIHLASRQAMDLIFDDLVLSYDPFA